MTSAAQTPGENKISRSDAHLAYPIGQGSSCLLRDLKLLAWAMWLVNIASGVAFFAGAYAIWNMFGASDPVIAVKWGVASLFLFQVTAMCKTLMGNRMEANRLLRELKRVELQVALLRDRTRLAS